MNYNIAHYFERKRINISDIIYLTRKTSHTVITLMNGESYSTTAMMKWLSSKGIIHDYSPEINKNLTIHCFQPSPGYCACVLIPTD